MKTTVTLHSQSIQSVKYVCVKECTLIKGASFLEYDYVTQIICRLISYYPALTLTMQE